MRILICGSGPAAIQIGQLAQSSFPEAFVCMIARASQRNRRFLDLYDKNKKLEFSVGTENPELNKFCGKLTVNHFCLFGDCLPGAFDLVIFAQPTFEYLTTLNDLLKGKYINSGATILTASSCLGSGAGLQSVLKEHALDCGVAIFSDYMAVTVRDPSNAMQVLATYEKSHLRLALLGQTHPEIKKFLLEDLKLYVSNLDLFESTWEAEQGNTNLFHIPIVIHPTLTSRFFDPQGPAYAMYAPYPCGAMSFAVTRQITQFEDELQAIYKALGLPTINLLAFRLARGHLSPEAFGHDVVENYPSLDYREREMIMSHYSWMAERQRLGLEGRIIASSLISVARFPRVVVTNSKGILPRVPFEDFVALKGILRFAQSAGIKTPVFERLCKQFENDCQVEPVRYGYTLETNLAALDPVIERNAKTFMQQAQRAKTVGR